jgi:hypothetical protein
MGLARLPWNQGGWRGPRLLVLAVKNEFSVELD